MNQSRVFLFFVSILSVLCYSCNSDIFIDDADAPQEMFATIEGNRGEVEFTIPVKGLQHITLDIIGGGNEYCTYYDKDGAVVTDEVSASRFGKIVFENRLISFDIVRNGNKIVFSSRENASTNALWIIRLEYDYITRLLCVDVLPGEKMQLVSVDYFNMEITDNNQIITRSVVYDNKSSSPLTVKIYPYLQENASILILPSSVDSWINGETLDMAVPIYDNGSWVMKEIIGIQPGVNYTYPHSDRMKEVEVSLPPYSVSRVRCDITYSRAEATGTMLFVNPYSHREQTADFTVISNYPVAYDISIEN